MQMAISDKMAQMEVATIIEQVNQKFIDTNKSRLADLSLYSTEALEWLMMEHYQFSFANVHFLTIAAERTGDFDTKAIQEELVRNCEEEDGHAAMYSAALKKVDCDVAERKEFTATTKFLATIEELMVREPSSVLGSMFATEAAAVFEHEVFRDITAELTKRHNWSTAQAGRLKLFHDMHLSGVEQSHRDELGIFLRNITPAQGVVAQEGERPTIDTNQALNGAQEAIDTMKIWWDSLMAELVTKSQKNQNHQSVALA